MGPWAGPPHEPQARSQGADRADPRPGNSRGDWLALLVILSGRPSAYLPVWHAGFIWDEPRPHHACRLRCAPLGALRDLDRARGRMQQYLSPPPLGILDRAPPLGGRSRGLPRPQCRPPCGGRVAPLAPFAGSRCPARSSPRGAFASTRSAPSRSPGSPSRRTPYRPSSSLAAALAYLRFDASRRLAPYALAALLFAMAFATKTVTAMLPAALLVVFWWQRGRLVGGATPFRSCRSSAWGPVPASSRPGSRGTYIGATGATLRLTAADRFLVAGRAGFYLGRFSGPWAHLHLPGRWDPDDGAVWQYFFPAAAAAALVVLFALRGRARGPLASALLFVGTLFPALGFINVYPFSSIPSSPTTSSTSLLLPPSRPPRR